MREPDEAAVRDLVRGANISHTLARLLAARGVPLTDVADLIEPTLKRLLPEPLLLKDMDKAVARAKAAIEGQRKDRRVWRLRRRRVFVVGVAQRFPDCARTASAYLHSRSPDGRLWTVAARDAAIARRRCDACHHRRLRRGGDRRAGSARAMPVSMSSCSIIMRSNTRRPRLRTSIPISPTTHRASAISAPRA